MTGELYKKPILFAIVAAAVILIGTTVTMFIPMLTEEMHPKLADLKPYTALQLAGKDIYQREGCNNCHTQTVRPLKTEVMRYGEYSKAGEFAYDRPFLWGSKRTGPDLARIGGKYPDKWHEVHFENPLAIFPQSNMPAYGWLKNNPLDPEEMEARMRANGFPYTADEVAQLKDKNELDAIIAYMQVIGTSVKKVSDEPVKTYADTAAVQNPLAGKPESIKRGASLFKEHCAACHGDDGKGGIGPSVADRTFLSKAEGGSDGDYFHVIQKGTQAGMPPYGGTMDKNSIWSIVSYIRSLQAKN
jgi:cytochrome c oxidase cbb3-type subunit 2